LRVSGGGHSGVCAPRGCLRSVGETQTIRTSEGRPTKGQAYGRARANLGMVDHRARGPVRASTAAGLCRAKSQFEALTRSFSDRIRLRAGIR
jgi:hypothetical protein